MQCYDCGGIYQEKSGRFEINDPYVGVVSVEGKYYQCNKCNEVLYPEETARAIDTARNNQLRELLAQRPIIDFLTASETASTLDISRQALHKHRRINRGFIYQTKFGGATVYLKESVLRFKETGDGRFPLYIKEHSPQVKYLESTLPLRRISSHVVYTSTIKTKESNRRLFYDSFASREEVPYAKN